MCNIWLEVKKLHPDAIIPKYAHDGDSGFDLHSIDEYMVFPKQTILVKTGLAVAVPKGFEMQIRMRSGLALKTGLSIPNAPGTVDSGYRGEIGIILHNGGHYLYTVKKGERIAQGVIAPVAHAVIITVNELESSERGVAGFGSTGS